MDRLASFANVSVTAGVQGTDGGQAMESGDEREGPVTLVDVAKFNEYGTVTAPPRPWLRTSLKRRRTRWGKLAGAAMTQGPASASQQGLQQLAVVMASDVKETLLAGPWEPNAPATIRKKGPNGSDQPLVDTGRLVQSQRAAIVIGDRTFLAG